MSYIKRIKRVSLLLAITVVIIILVVGILFFVGEIITPKNETISQMRGIIVRICEYTKANDKLPETLEVLPVRPNYDDDIKDGWGYPIEYSVNGDIIILTSLGKDNALGGENDNSDITVSFDMKNSIFINWGN